MKYDFNFYFFCIILEVTFSDKINVFLAILLTEYNFSIYR